MFYNYATRAQPRNPFCHFLFSGVSGGIRTSIRGFRVRCSTTMLPGHSQETLFVISFLLVLGVGDKCFTTMQPMHNQETLFAFFLLPVPVAGLELSILGFRVKHTTTMLPGHNHETLFSNFFFLVLAVGLEPQSDGSESSVLPLCYHSVETFSISSPWCQ